MSAAPTPSTFSGNRQTAASVAGPGSGTRHDRPDTTGPSLPGNSPALPVLSDCTPPDRPTEPPRRPHPDTSPGPPTAHFGVWIMDYTNAVPSANGRTAAGIGGFDAAEPAPEFKPIPPGIYAARVQRGEYTTTKAGADAYRIRFEIAEGEQKGKSVVRIWTFGEKAIGYTKRDLSPFGLTTTAQ